MLPLNIVGMPYYDTPLLSNFSLAEYATASSPMFHPPAKIPASVLSSMRVFSGVGYAVLPKEMQGKRNVVCKSSKANLLVDRRGKFVRGDAAEGGAKFGADRRESGPRFRSEKSRAGNAAVDDVSNLKRMTMSSRLIRGISFHASSLPQRQRTSSTLTGNQACQGIIVKWKSSTLDLVSKTSILSKR
ncbi:hypothetical protein QFC22_004222 [Naganishia vaughanmartiniae]|uniref:Uncharacterized protein n=1 Tax=Naganishia vaughanmartiniae TaxID=1424756 RepID=A0ACC2X3S3_9TREE|nr:hypothetical protein QFC22_004222 [Naganishia vaughanmartiniae]